MAKKNTGKEYELLTQKIYQAIVDGDYQDANVRNIQVRQNVVLPGKCGGTNQIDVYWEFEQAGFKYKVIVEVKDWSKPVEQSELHAFKGKIDDISGTVKGIFVSRSGFQNGAKIYAEANNIELVQISKESGDAEVSVRISHTTTNYINVAICVDEVWCNAQSLSMHEVERIINGVAFEDTYLLNPNEEKVSLFELMCKDAVPYYKAPEGEHHTVERALCGSWHWISEETTQKIKITAYSFECYNTCIFSKLFLKIKDFPTYCVKNIILKKQQYFYLTPQNNAVKVRENIELPMICL